MIQLGFNDCFPNMHLYTKLCLYLFIRARLSKLLKLCKVVNDTSYGLVKAISVNKFYMNKLRSINNSSESRDAFWKVGCTES